MAASSGLCVSNRKFGGLEGELVVKSRLKLASRVDNSGLDLSAIVYGGDTPRRARRARRHGIGVEHERALKVVHRVIHVYRFRLSWQLT